MRINQTAFLKHGRVSCFAKKEGIAISNLQSIYKPVAFGQLFFFSFFFREYGSPFSMVGRLTNDWLFIYLFY